MRQLWSLPAWTGRPARAGAPRDSVGRVIRAGLLWVVVALGVVTGQARLAHADTLTMGGMSVQPFSGAFAFAGATFQASGHFDAHDFFSQCVPCPPGTLITPSLGIGGGAYLDSGALVVDGVTYPWLGTYVPPGTFGTADIQFVATGTPFVLPPVGALPGLTMTLPFTITGAYSSGTGVFGSFSGGGTETITFDLYHGVTPPHWTMTSATWQVVAPTPEPSTVLLAGSGLAGLCAAAWTRRRTQATARASGSIH